MDEEKKQMPEEKKPTTDLLTLLVDALREKREDKRGKLVEAMA